MMTARAGGTASGGILGRRKCVLPEPPIFVTMWQSGRLVRCRLSEARKYGSAATLPERGNDPLQVQHFRGSPGQSGGTDPRGKRLPRCRYCGAASAYPWGAPQICTGCEKLRDRHEAPAGGWIGDDKLYLRVQRTLANRERAAAAEQFQKHGPGRLEREGPTVKVSEAVAKAKRAARAKFRQPVTEFAEAAE